ncbi:alkaline phosphatase family protein [Pyxidicoccus fallax]|uniref:Alkaline phosphatase family protein n=1 Tax=Pyxidicoccus fallax TaxID=394095 RepID=A0A848L9M6_9BACT|nr:alkaline phosphatase D family protein [Pyxidicoccus fallax]NMO13555.1 alkaline phosphatase family protein [Pyxidicoccus fallax]NPC76737.1 alkaline phosphatase family protein [Pyxidicoccus fallax]
MTRSSVPGVLLGMFVAIGLVVPSVAHAYAAPLVRVPFVGRAWTTGASIWVGTSESFGDAAGETLTLRAREADACETCWVATVQMTSAGTGGGFRSWKGALDGLKSNTRYHYGIFAAGFTGERGGFYFKTEPAGPARFKVGVASCMNGANAPSQPSWNIMHEQLNTGEPNIQLLIGDNMYTTENPPSKDHYWFKYFQQRAVPEFANVFRAFPTFAVWDDHDYGPNDEDGTFAQKAVAREAYADLYPHPPFAGDGINHTFNWGGVQFFMMDDRWGRDCPKNPPAGHTPQMYGATQFTWLKTELKASNATFKVIVNGSTLGNACWGTQKQALFDFIADNKIGGVLFVTGDIHRSLLTDRTPAGGYPLYELISSGIGSPSTPAEWSFGIMEFNTTLADPTVTLKVIQNPEKRSSITGAGVTVTTKTLRRSQLQN